MPVGPSYRLGVSAKRSRSAWSVALPLIGSGRVYGTSASSAPSSTTRLTSRLWHSSSTSSQKVRQRVLGSMPRISTTSVPAPGGLATENRVVGHVDPALAVVALGHGRPVHLEVVELLRVELGDRLGGPDLLRCSTTAVDASAASFQPSKAAMATGERNTGRPSNSLTHPTLVGLRTSRPGARRRVQRLACRACLVRADLS